MMTNTSRRRFLAGSAAIGAGCLAVPAIVRAQETVIRWGEMLPPTHPQVQMIDRIAAAAKEKSGASTSSPSRTASSARART
jgi:TRAP-type C4-dicarboxylate transport system substrate-binding protein